MSGRSAAGDFSGADEWLGQAIAWREAARGKDDPRIADDLLLSAGFQRKLGNYDRALDILRRVQGLHAAIYGSSSPLYADDFTRMARIYAEQKRNVPAIAMHLIALDIRARIAGPLDPSLGGRPRPPGRTLHAAGGRSVRRRPRGGGADLRKPLAEFVKALPAPKR